VIAMQTSDRRPPVPPDPLSSSDGPGRHQRQHVDARPDPRSPQFQQLLARLEADYEFHTTQLAQLAQLSAGPADFSDTFERNSFAVASRQALNAIAIALRDMAEGRYGTCASCAESIPIERLEARPEARHCLRCQTSSKA
jgi:DnaK suppressor protein